MGKNSTLGVMDKMQGSTEGAGIAGVVLAAGASRRLGRPKQLVELDGVPLLVRAGRAMLSHCEYGVICVLGAHAAEVEAALEGMPVQVVVNSSWGEGIAASIRAGVQQVPTDARAILLSVCDQPLVDSADIGRLAAAWQEEPSVVVAAGYSDGCGVPAIFPATYRDDLIALKGDRGAKALLGAATHRRVVDMPNAAFDVDDRTGLARVVERAGRNRGQ